MGSDDWFEGEVADACESIDYGLTASASKGSSGVRFLRITDIVGSGIDWSAVPYVVADTSTAEKYRLHDGDIVVARTGASTGSSAYISQPPAAVFASYLVRLKTNSSFDSRFLAYYLKSPCFWSYMHGVLGDKSAQPNASASTMTKAPFRAPRDLSEQTAISAILGALDNKIELNRKMNATLEGMARTLFTSWFVDFDPVRAKAEGRETGLSPEIAALFSDSCAQSQLGEIPSGWRVDRIGDLADVVGGSTPSTSESMYWDGPYAWVTPKDLAGLATPVLLSTQRTISKEGLSKISSGLLPVGTVLLSSRAPIGYLAIAQVPVAINQGFIAMKARPGVSNLFLLRWAKSAHAQIAARANGSTFLEISKTNFRPIPVIVPPVQIMRRFDELARPLHDRLVLCERESRSLATLRDALLPRLISGELRVGDAHCILEKSA
jgi:type I restriction enzyme S subunit